MADSADAKQQIIGSHSVQAINSKVTQQTIQLPALKPISAVPPRPPDPFCGRSELIASIVTDLTSVGPTPVLALLGMGGIGKTALAKQIAKVAKEDFPGGIFWGELPLTDNDPHVILKQWGRLCGENLKKETAENLPTVVRGLLMERQTMNGRLLVIVDDARLDWRGASIKTIKDILPPDVSMIITTRQVQVAQQVNARIINLDVLARQDSCKLLASLAGSDMTEAEASEIADLCGDMPLALDLMGKLASKIGCKRLLKRLRSGVSRLRLLKQEDPVKLSWEISYQELVQQHPEAARIFRMLASFTQPVFLICEHLAGILAQEKKIVMPALSLEECRIGAEDELIRLANWSLLQEDKSIEGEKNQYFRVHPLLHEYAQSVLVEADERRDAIRNHLLYCIAFVEANPQVDLQKHERSTVEFEKSYGQLLQALIEIKKHQVIDPVDWQKDGTTAHQVILLVDALDNYWEFHNQFSEQAEWLPLAYACAGALSDPIGQADFARRLGRALGWQGKLDEALEWMDRSEDALGGDESDKAQALRALLCIHRASIVYQKGDDEEAEKDCLRGVALVDAEKQPRIYAEGYNLLGVIQMNIGRLTSALEALEKSLSTWKQVGDQYQIFRAADNARTVLFYLGDMTNLREAEDAGLQYWEQFPNHIDLAIALTNRGLVHQIDGEYQAAIKLHKRAIEISDRLAVRRMQATTRANIADTYISLGQYDEAQAYVKQSMEIQTHYDTKESWVDAHRSLAEVALGRKLYGQAVELAESALGIAREDKDPLEEGSALRVLGRALYMNGDLERARECLEESLILLQRKGFRYESFLTLQALAKLYEAVGEAEKAQAIAEQAKSLASQMGINMQNPSSDIE